MKKPFWIGLALLATCWPALIQAQTPTAVEVKNKQLVQRTFDNWAQGHGTLYDLLADDARWTLTGSSALSKTYTSKQEFIDATVTPLFKRLAQPFVPKVRQLNADGDVVVVQFDGTSTANDGQPYCNAYCLVMTFKNGRITNTVAYLDLLAYTELLRRVPAKE